MLRLRLLAVAPLALVSALVGFTGTTPAIADEPTVKCPFISVADSTKASMAVFSGEVTSTDKLEKPSGEQGTYFVQDVTVDRVYRGQVHTEQVVVRSEKTPKACSLGELSVGADYMFFVASSGDPWIAESGKGTVLLDPEVTVKVERLLGSGKPPVPPTPESAEFTRVSDAEPMALSRVAAPGLSLVLVGLLGLLGVGVARRLGRRG